MQQSKKKKFAQKKGTRDSWSRCGREFGLHVGCHIVQNSVNRKKNTLAVSLFAKNTLFPRRGVSIKVGEMLNKIWLRALTRGCAY